MSFLLGAVAAADVAASGGAGVPCVGYLVSGAGTAAVDGCYVASAHCACPDKACFTLEDGGSSQQIFNWKGIWHLGHCSHPGTTYYFTTHRASLPPESAAGGGAWTNRNGNHTLPAPRRARRLSDRTCRRHRQNLRPYRRQYRHRRPLRRPRCGWCSRMTSAAPS